MSDQPGPGRARRPDVIAIAAMLAAILLAFWPVATLQRSLFYFDISEHNVPFRHFFAEALKQGRFPLWTQSLNAGFPIFAEGQGGPLHPLNFVFYPLLSTWKAFNLTFILQLCCGALGTYALMRRHAEPAGCAVAGTAFALSGAQLMHHFHMPIMAAVCLLPAFLCLMSILVEKPSVERFCACAACLAAIHFSGHPQSTLLTGFSAAALLLVPSGRFEWRRPFVVLALLAGVFAIGTALAAIQLLPTWELAPLSVRGQPLSLQARSESSWPPAMLLNLFLPHAFGSLAMGTQHTLGDTHFHEVYNFVGALTVLAAWFALLHPARRVVAAFCVLTAVSLLLALGRHTPFFEYVSSLPIANHLRIPARANLLVDLGIACFAALGVHAILCESTNGWRRRVLIPFGGMAVVVWTAVDLYLRDTGWLRDAVVRDEVMTDLRLRVALFGVGVALVVGAIASRRKAPVYVFGFVVVADLVLFARDVVPTVATDYWTHVPPAVETMWRVDPSGRMTETHCSPLYEPRGWRRNGSTAHHRALDRLNYNVPLYYGLSTTRGYTPLRLQSFHEAVASARSKDTIPEALGSRFLVSCKPTERAALTLLSSAEGVHVYESSLSRRAFMAAPRGVAGAANGRRFVDIDNARAVRESESGCGADDVRIVSSEDERVELSVNAGCAGYVVLLDALYPGWEAFVDDEPANIQAADRAFRAVFVERGKHTVRFEFHSASFRGGAWISALTLAALIIAVILKRRGCAMRWTGTLKP